MMTLLGLWGCAPASAPRTTPTSAASPSATLPTSTLSGAYTIDQATRGRNIYLGQCRSCHNPSTGSAFERLWVGKTVSDLFTYIHESMPPNDPGSLSRTDNADVVSFLLQATGLPAGTHDLPADRDSLKSIRIELKKQPN
jgi:mono/diheme cytochrome c family protein